MVQGIVAVVYAAELIVALVALTKLRRTHKDSKNRHHAYGLTIFCIILGASGFIAYGVHFTGYCGVLDPVINHLQGIVEIVTAFFLWGVADYLRKTAYTHRS